MGRNNQKKVFTREPVKEKVVKTNRPPVYNIKFKWGLRSDIIDWDWENQDYGFSPRKDIIHFLNYIKPSLDNLLHNNWQEVEQRKGNHSWDINNLDKVLIERYIEKFGQNAEYETLYQLRLNSKYRLYGIRIESTFYILWKDPEHKGYYMNITDN